MGEMSVTRSLALNWKPGGAIVGVRGSNFGRILRIQPEIEILLGRDTEHCDICFSNKKVSRKHCGIMYHSKKKLYSVRDYSGNGTYRDDGHRLKKGERLFLPPGTELWLGTKEEAVKLG